MKASKTMLLFAFVLITSCGGKQPMFKTVNDLIRAIEPYTQVIVLGDPDGAMLAVTPEYGAKVIAMSVNGTRGKNFLWPNPKIGTKEFWAGPSLNWNLGGARTWIAPEADFYLDQDQNWFVPEAMDPGHYKLDWQEQKLIVCSNEFQINNNKNQRYHLKIVRTIELLDQKPEFISSEMKYVGLRFTHELINLSNQIIGQDVDYVGLWSLIQLDTAGTMIIPIQHDPAHQNITVRDYGPTNFNTVPPERMTIGDDYISVKIDGKYRCKLGFAPWAARNGIAYLSYRKNSDQGILFLKQFDVDPNGVYLDHPWEKPYDYGDAIQMYNDDGRFGGFCEIECHAPAKTLAPNESLAHTVTLSVILGSLDSLKQIVADQLKIDFSQVVLY